ncbi:hypothetical protein [Ruminococcus sp. Marseille-P6503]|uniref:hypothetical protein n=1 Tax=Ruminococcus sp. Marseille-P6503 TaxID=2364796 RepID=UPI000F5446DC|nr:hypothetical protein [Ruminococcus sp. Marseille-P6503]
MSQTKQKSSAAKNVAIFFVVFIILEMLIIFGVSRVFKNKDVTPSFAGYSLYIMNDDRMGDDVPKGALVVASNGVPSVEGIGKAVLVENVPNIGTSVFWLADVSSKGDSIDGVVYTVYQEKNPSVLYEVKSSDIVGSASSYYLTAGKVITFVTSTFGMAVCAIVPLFFLVLIELIIAIASHSGEEDEYEAEPEKDETNVTLDDFLFGGENDKALHNSHIHDEEQEDAEQEEEPAETDGGIGNDAEASEKTDSEGGSEVDESYYEKASKLLDEAASEKSDNFAEDIAADKASEPEAQTPASAGKTASASLEDLMKLMEEEQKKLRDQLNKE